MTDNWSPKWTIKKLNYNNGRPMDFPWHVIPPYTPIPPRNVTHSDLVRLYRRPGASLAGTQAAALVKVQEKIREAGDG